MTVTNSFNCFSISNDVSVTSVTCPAADDTLDVRVLIEGYYSSNGLMNNFGNGGCLFVTGNSGSISDADTIRISLVDSASHSVVPLGKAILKTNGHVRIAYPSSALGNRYYLKLVHRNALETWSARTVPFISPITSYDFTTAANKAYGNNQTQSSDGFWMIYSGDISDVNNNQPIGQQDGIVEAQDYLDMENAVSIIKSGYVFEDITGDGLVEAQDYLIMENAVSAIRSSIHP
jgi:hypothetical protein